MKFYNSLGPNPRLVRMFMLEKGIQQGDAVEVDLMGGENRRAPYTDRNPSGQLPALELDDGRTISETIAICEYLEELHPQPALIGGTPEERATSRMWTRRVEWKIIQPLTDAFRFGEGKQMFEGRFRLLPEASDGLKAIARDGYEWLDAQLTEDFITGSTIGLPDIALYCIADFGAGVGQPIDPALKNVNDWFSRMNGRPSSEASLHPVAKAGGMRA